MDASALLIVRALNLAAGALALGVPATLAFVILPVAGRICDDRMRGVLERGARLIWATLAVEFITACLWLVLQTAAMSGLPLGEAAAPALLRTTLGETQFGHVLLLRQAMVMVLAVILALRRWGGVARQLPSLRLAALAGLLGLVPQAWAGHAVTTPGPLHLAADALHLVGAGLWLGGLFALVVVFSLAREQGPSEARLAMLADVAQRFSLLGIAAVAGLVASGLVNSWYLVGTVPALLGTPYGHLLLLKLLLFAAMLALAGVNRLRLTPLLAAGPRRRLPGAADGASRLRRNAILEAGLGVAVIAIVSALGAVPPALHDQPWWPFSFRFSLEATGLPAVRNEVLVAAAMSIAGVMLVGLGLVRPRHRLIGLPLGLVLLACFLPSFRLLAVTAYPTSFAVSPVAYTANSIAHGGRIYAEHCVACHGAGGQGDGPAGKTMRVPPANLTDAHVYDHPEGDLFWWLSAGIPESGMPGFAAALSEDDRWDLVNWVRTLPAGGLGEGLATEVGDGPAPRAPDFTFTGPDGSEGSLQAMLRDGAVLLVLFTPNEDGIARVRLLSLARPYLRAAGLQVLTLPLAPQGGEAESEVTRFVVAERSVTQVYRLLASTPRYRLPMKANHLEYLIDPNGYVRALWMPQETAAWSEPGSLIPLMRQLAAHPLGPGTPPSHSH